MASGDFYHHDRPAHPRLAEDRPRGGGPDEPHRRGNWATWAVVLAIIVLFVILTVALG
ncbi:hypothetical protein GCM10010129_20590 [Streptomyces fumigatiscleroticus]|nr:hypothetical protein GCM10010129_20590 [Streptomyces fumigatiscleroticus]